MTRLLRLPEPAHTIAPPQRTAPQPQPAGSEARGIPLTEDFAEQHVATTCFNVGSPRHYGVELEWLVHDRSNPLRSVAAGQALASSCQVRHGQLTTEPGGQLEYSSTPSTSLDGCFKATQDDMAGMHLAAQEQGVRLVGFGLDPYREPRRLLDRPRYAAMERFFDREGPAGRWMMCATASVQVCLDAGTAGRGVLGFRHRWRLAHLLGPVLIATFANSPLARSRPTGWASARQAIWSRMDPTRTSPVSLVSPQSATRDPALEWARYALDAKVMCIRRPDGQVWQVPPSLTFRNWIHSDHQKPTLDDLEYHLTTLFPPVRPRGYLEFRMIDAQQGDGWLVPMAVCSTLLDDPVAGDIALAAVEPLWTLGPGGDPWRRAAREGLADRKIAMAAITCMKAVIQALPAGPIREAVETYAQRYTLRGRCPGDDVLNRYRVATARLIA